jgi:hypothetical protein
VSKNSLKSYLNTPLGIVESQILLNSDIYYNEKVGLATRLDLIRVFWSEIDFTQCSLKLE